MTFKINNAYGNYVVIEPLERSSVLKADEISTVFIVVATTSDILLCIGDLVIVTPGSVEKTKMGTKDIYYVRESEIVATVSREDNSTKTFTGSH